MTEIWKPIKGYESLYEVSNLGNVKRLVGFGCRKERILKPSKTQKGYLQVNLLYNGRPRCFFVHRLVAEAFLPNTDNLSTVNHKDEDKTNNRVDNLEWMSCKDNINYGSGIRRSAEKRKKPVNQYTKDGVFIQQWKSATDASRELSISARHICLVCNKRKGLKSAGGFKWFYDDDQNQYIDQPLF